MNHSRTARDPPRNLSNATRDRQARLDDVYNGLQKGGGLRKAVKHTLPFFCESDIRQLWVDSENLGLILHDLTPDRLDILWKTSLLFITFLVHIEMPLSFFTSLPQLLFHQNDETPLYQDAGMPYNKNQLAKLGLPRKNCARAKEQHCFTPVTLRFNSKILEVQSIPNKLTRIPFVKHEKVKESGAHGMVNFFQLAAEYIDDEEPSSHQISVSTEKTVAVAVKSFHNISSSSPINAEDEIRIQSILRQGNASGQSIVLAVAAVEHRRRGLLIFYPRAELGDLGQFLRGGLRHEPHEIYEESRRAFRKRFPDIQDTWGSQVDSSLAQALLKQCAGLASALNFLHKGFQGPNGSWLRLVHMDLKPENIVLFGGDVVGAVGHWKLCDFGLSASVVDENKGASNRTSFELLRARTLDMISRRKGGQYQAPEVEEEESVGRSSDIWSFGCIFAEVLAFALGGPKAVKSFLEARRQQHKTHSDHGFHSLVGSQASSSRVVRPQALQWLEQQCGRDQSPPVWASCWAGHICKILQVDRNKRPLAEQLVECVNHVLEDAHRCARDVTPECQEFRHTPEASTEQLSEEQDVTAKDFSSPLSVSSQMFSTSPDSVSTSEPSTAGSPTRRQSSHSRRVHFSDAAIEKGNPGAAMSHHGWRGAGPSLLR